MNCICLSMCMPTVLYTYVCLLQYMPKLLLVFLLSLQPKQHFKRKEKKRNATVVNRRIESVRSFPSVDVCSLNADFFLFFVCECARKSTSTESRDSRERIRYPTLGLLLTSVLLINNKLTICYLYIYIYTRTYIYIYISHIYTYIYACISFFFFFMGYSLKLGTTYLVSVLRY